MLTLGNLIDDRFIKRTKFPVIWGYLPNDALIFVCQGTFVYSAFMYAEPIVDDRMFQIVGQELEDSVEDSLLQHYTNYEKDS